GGGGGVGGTGGRGGGGRKSYRNLAVVEKTVFDAIRQLSMLTPRRLYFAHNQVIVLSEQLVRHRGVNEILDFFDRNPQIRRDNWVLVARGKVGDIMDAPPGIETTPAQRITGEINNREQSSFFSPTRLGDFIQMLEEPATEPYTAMVGLLPNPAVSKVAFDPGGPGPEPAHDVKLVGTAVFRRDRLAGWLDERETRGLLWVRGQVQGGPVKFPSPHDPHKDVAVDILRAGRGGSKLEPVLQDGRPGMRIKIKTRVNLVETQDLHLDLDKPEVIEELQKQLEKTIREEVMAAVTRLQEDYHADCFGFGSAFHRKYPAFWRQAYLQWQDVFPAIPVEVEVNAVIRRTGLVTRPMRPGSGEKLQLPGG
ncbi:Ger(x)C family spore germination protein, partial [Desulfotomaculum copahuensis]